MKRTLCFALLALLLAVPVRAADLADGLGTGALRRALPESAAEALEGIDAADAELDTGLGRLWSYLRAKLSGALAEVLRPLAAVLAVTVLSAVGARFAPAGGFDYVGFGGALAVTAVCVGDVKSVVSLGASALGDLRDLSAALLPTLTAAAAASGAVGSAAAKYAAAAMFTDLLLSLAENLIFPLICAYTAAVAAGAALGTDQLAAGTRLLHWGAKTLMRSLVLAFTAYLGITGVVAGQADAAAVKAARTALSAALPVVGRTIADVSDSLVAGAGVLRGSIGVFGALAVGAAAALPVLRLGLRCLLFQAAAALAGVVAAGRLGRLIDGIGNAYGLVLGLVGAASIIELLAVFSLMKVVTA